MFGIWIAMVYIARPSMRRSGAFVTRVAAGWSPDSGAIFGADRIAAARFSRAVGDEFNAISGRVSFFSPPRTSRPGTTSVPEVLLGLGTDAAPVGSGFGPAEKFAARDPGGGAKSGFSTGCNPAMARFGA